MNTSCAIIVPCFNEANRIDIAKFEAFNNHNANMSFYFINDGSSDNTKSILDGLSNTSERFHSLRLETNVGKAEAIRHGFLKLNSIYDYVGYLDADLSTPLEEIERLLHYAQNKQKPFVMGSRIKRIGSDIDRRLKRHISGRIVATIIDSFILQLGIYDTQCGAKIIDYNLAKVLFAEPFKTKWLFDVELILRAKLKYGKAYCLDNIHEVPLLEWKDIGASKISNTDILKLPFDFIKIYNHYK
ncbi:glycosyltransferase [Hanstruepera ponticola]|uniref:glycosyltransferase n=1 Tax=Hanstruepera ponticola TaxID=2042995 RepID=UPI000CF0EADE|nr:glycosyltransferase [Hanstruepera ponticola]